MRVGGAEVVDTFAEAFGMWGARIVVTADRELRARVARLGARAIGPAAIPR